MLANAAGDNAPVVGEVGGDVERDAVEGDPAADPHPDRRDLGLAAVGRDPDADAALAAQADDAKRGERVDQPCSRSRTKQRRSMRPRAPRSSMT